MGAITKMVVRENLDVWREEAGMCARRTAITCPEWVSTGQRLGGAGFAHQEQGRERLNPASQSTPTPDHTQGPRILLSGEKHRRPEHVPLKTSRCHESSAVKIVYMARLATRSDDHDNNVIY